MKASPGNWSSETVPTKNRINDFSLEESFPDGKWISRAQRAISKCDVVVVLLGRNTHNASGVLEELLNERLASNRVKLAELERELADFPNKARRAGVPPGWFRELTPAAPRGR